MPHSQVQWGFSDRAQTWLFVGAVLMGLLAGAVPGFWPIQACSLALFGITWIAVQIAQRRGIYLDKTGDIACFAFVAVVIGLVALGARLFVTTPGLPLTAFWLYAIVASGFMVSRCCLGWHVGGSVAVLMSFLAFGLWVRSFYGGGSEWLVLLIFSAAVWWGADSWRRANGLALNE